MAPRPAPPVDAATRIAAGAARLRYDGVAITLHWLTAVMVLTQFVLAEVWGWFAKPTRHELIVAHMTIGILLTGVILARILWRLTPGHQVRSAVQGWVEQASKAVHYLLYALLAVEATLGWINRWSGGEALSFFTLPVPSPFGKLSRPTHHLINEAHDLLAWAIIIIAAGHALAALYHHFVVRDQVLARMLPRGRLRDGQI